MCGGPVPVLVVLMVLVVFVVALYLGTGSNVLIMVLTTSVSISDKVRKNLVYSTHPIGITRLMRMMMQSSLAADRNG